MISRRTLLLAAPWCASARSQPASPPAPAPVTAPGPAPLGAPAQTAPRVPSASAPVTPAARAARPIFVLNSLEASVSVIDPHTYVEVKRLATGKEPHHLYLTPDEKSIIVANALSDSLSFIDPVTAEIQRTVTGILDPYHLRFSPDMKWFVTAANRLNHVDIYRWQPAMEPPLQLMKRVAAPRTPSHLAIDSRSTTVYSSLQDSDELVAIDLATQALRWKVPCGKLPADVFLTADDRHLLVGMTGDEYVEVYDVTQPQPRLAYKLKTGAGAHAFRARGDRRHVFVSNRVANTISLIDTMSMQVLEHYPAPGGPDCMELLSDRKTLLVTSRWARRLTFVDTEKKQVIRQVPVGRSPHGVWTLDHAPRL